jgi:5-methylcytosine-specific restriction endonuclease McrA
MVRLLICCMIQQITTDNNHAKSLRTGSATLHQHNNNGSEKSRDTYRKKLQQIEWQTKRQQILKRDGFKCRNCNSTKLLQIHHRQYHISKNSQIKKDPWSYQDKYLITLCNVCHENGHKKYKVTSFKI